MFQVCKSIYTLEEIDLKNTKLNPTHNIKWKGNKPKSPLYSPSPTIKALYIPKAKYKARKPSIITLNEIPSEYLNSLPNQIALFNGSSAISIASNSFDLPDGPFTLEAWVSPTTKQKSAGLVTKTEQSDYGFFLREGKPQFNLHLNGKYSIIESETPLPLNQWSHIMDTHTKWNIISE